MPNPEYFGHPGFLSWLMFGCLYSEIRAPVGFSPTSGRLFEVSRQNWLPRCLYGLPQPHQGLPLSVITLNSPGMKSIFILHEHCCCFVALTLIAGASH
jgi:hypothetical protein